MDIQEVIDLKKQLEDDFRKDAEAIDRVLALLKKRNANAPTQTPTSKEGLPPEIIRADAHPKIENKMLIPTTGKFNFGADPKAISSNVNKNGNAFGRVRDTGVKGIAKQAVPFLPITFLRKDLVNVIGENFPEWRDKLTKDAISGAVKRLIEDDLIKIETKAVGKQPTRYRRLID